MYSVYGISKPQVDHCGLKNNDSLHNIQATCVRTKYFQCSQKRTWCNGPQYWTQMDWMNCMGLWQRKFWPNAPERIQPSGHSQDSDQLTLCAVSKPLGCFRVVLRSSSLNGQGKITHWFGPEMGQSGLKPLISIIIARRERGGFIYQIS